MRRTTRMDGHQRGTQRGMHQLQQREVWVFSDRKRQWMSNTTPTSTNNVITAISPTSTMITSAESQRQRWSRKPDAFRAGNPSFAEDGAKTDNGGQKPSVPPIPFLSP